MFVFVLLPVASQEELNCGAGVWEHLCLEKDPFILAGLMWSWLEQLKEPVLSVKDVQILGEGRCDPKTVLSRLEKVRGHGSRSLSLHYQLIFIRDG